MVDLAWDVKPKQPLRVMFENGSFCPDIIQKMYYMNVNKEDLYEHGSLNNTYLSTACLN